MKPQVRTRQVKIFKNGRNQAVRIPREFELPGEDAIMRKEGERLIIEPAPPSSLSDVADHMSFVCLSNEKRHGLRNPHIHVSVRVFDWPTNGLSVGIP